MTMTRNKKFDPEDYRAPLAIEQAAEFLNVEVRWMRRAVFERRIAYPKLGGHLRFRTEHLQAYLDANRVEPQALAVPGIAHGRIACQPDNDLGRRRLLQRPRAGRPAGLNLTWRALRTTEQSWAGQLVALQRCINRLGEFHALSLEGSVCRVAPGLRYLTLAELQRAGAIVFGLHHAHLRARGIEPARIASLARDGARWRTREPLALGMA